MTTELEKFIQTHLNSVEQLEILLILAGSKREWAISELADRLCTTPTSVHDRLKELVDWQLAARIDGTQKYVYAPANETLGRLVTELDAEYRARRITIINMIYAKPIANIRTIADAFRFREDKK